MDAVIYKVCSEAEWQEAKENGAYTGAPVDLADGFIHFSTATQLEETVRKHFSGRDGLLVVAIAAGALGDALKWEPSRGGALFPHLYADLGLEHVLWTRPMPLVDGEHVLPELEDA